MILQRSLLKKENSDPIAYSIVLNSVTGLILAAFAIANHEQIPNLVPLLPGLMIMTLLYSIGTIYIYKSLKLLDASEFTVIFALRSIFTMIGASIFLLERVSIFQIFGTLFVFGGIAFINWKNRKFHFSKGTIFAIIASAAIGLAFVNDAFLMDDFNVSTYLAIAFIVPSLAIYLGNMKKTQSCLALLALRSFPKLFVTSIFYAISALCIFSAYKVGQNASQIAPLSQTSVILIVILSYIFLKERGNVIKKIVGTALVFVGVLLLA